MPPGSYFRAYALAHGIFFVSILGLLWNQGATGPQLLLGGGALGALLLALHAHKFREERQIAGDGASNRRWSQILSLAIQISLAITGSSYVCLAIYSLVTGGAEAIAALPYLFVIWTIFPGTAILALSFFLIGIPVAIFMAKRLPEIDSRQPAPKLRFD